MKKHKKKSQNRLKTRFSSLILLQTLFTSPRVQENHKIRNTKRYSSLIMQIRSTSSIKQLARGGVQRDGEKIDGFGEKTDIS